MLDWLNNVDMKILVITKNNSGDIIPMHCFPAGPKGKFCYFVRRTPEEITKDNVRQVSFNQNGFYDLFSIFFSSDFTNW